MAHVAPVYASFSKGEVSPLLLGRIDIDQYPTCLDKCRNMVIRPYGCASRVVGTEYINSSKDSSKVRLLKFVFSATDSYIIECGAGYFRFYQNGGIVLKDDAEDWETSKAYKKGDFSKNDDKTYYCLEDHTSGTFEDDLAADKWVEQNIYELPNNFVEEQLSSIQYVQIDDIIKLVCLPAGDDNTTAKPTELIRKSSDDWEFKEVEFKETPYLDQNTTDITIAPSGTSGSITLTASADYFDAKMVGTNFWIGSPVLNETTNEKEQGFVKITGFTNARVVSAEVKSVLSGTDATKLWAEGAFSDYRGYPAAIALFDGRLYYARTPHQPRNIYGSVPYSYEKFTPSVSNNEDGAINVQLATNANGDGSDIRWMSGASYLLCGTYGGEFVVKSTGDSAITPLDISARQRSNWGGEHIQPVVSGSFVHFIQRNGNKLRQFQYDFYTDSYKAVDVSIFSETLLESPIKELAYQKNVDSSIYMMREDGNVAVLSLEQEQEVRAWSLLEFKGKVESIETIPAYDGNYDEVWIVINRKINGVEQRYIERMINPITPEIQDRCWYVRSGLRYNAFEKTIGNSITLSDKTGDVTITAENNVFSIENIGRKIRVIDNKHNVIGQALITGYVSETEVTARVVKEFKHTHNNGGTWGISVIDISGLEHLEAEKVQIFADGAEQTEKVVINGAITLELDGWYILVGLGYTSYMATLPLEAGSQNGTAMGKRKRIGELSLRVWRTLGCRVGSSLEDLLEVKLRTPKDILGMPVPMFTGIIPNIKYNQGWVWDANIIVEQSKPFPLNVLAIAPIVTEVDK